MLRIRRGNCRTNHDESRRMYPARQTRSTLCCFSAATTSRSCSSRGLPFEGITNAFNFLWRAVVMPGASALLEMTTATLVSGMRPASILSAIATKFEPRPERRIPRECMLGAFRLDHHKSECRSQNEEVKSGLISFCLLISALVVNHLTVALNNPAHGKGLLAHALQHSLGFFEFRQRNDQQHPEPHVESAQHFVLWNVAQLPQMFK